MEIIEPSVQIETPSEHIRDYMKLIEGYGRTCRRWDKRENDPEENFVSKRLVGEGLESVLEHCSITARFICDRSASHQLVRHRIGSYSQESQRAIDYSSGIQVICPPSIKENGALFEQWKKSIGIAEAEYIRLLKEGIAAEDARSVLPNCTKTEIVATFNLRMWRHVFVNRALNPRAQWQIRDLMTILLKEMNRLLPVIFEDLQQKILYRLVFEAPGNEDG